MVKVLMSKTEVAEFMLGRELEEDDMWQLFIDGDEVNLEINEDY